MSVSSSCVPKKIFRAYDIRGIVGDGLDNSVIELIGRAIGSEAIDQGEMELVLAADARLSSPEFSVAMKKGILSTGCNVLDLGVVPTPLMYFATHTLNVHSGVMITGSHNPKTYNGVKIVLKRQCLSENQITLLRERIINNNFHCGQGNYLQHDIREQYIQRICSDSKVSRPYKVVIDCGNAVTAAVAPELFSRLGCEISLLYCELDGNFPNHHPDPTKEKNLQDLIKKVLAENADIGIAFDGDGDRVGLVSNAGEVIDADKLMMSFIKDILPNHPNEKVVFDVKSSQHLQQLINENNGQAIMCKSGHSFVKQKMQETGALLGGEFSAHIFLKHRWYGFDDGLYVATRFLEIMEKNNCTAQDLLTALPEIISTPELSINVSEKEKFSLMASLLNKMIFNDASLNKLDGLRVDFACGWGLIRASNTTPKLVLRFEADSHQNLQLIIDRFKKEILRILPSLVIDF